MTTKITEKNISSLANAGVNWQAVVVADGSTGLTAVAGRGYFINTTSGTQTVTFPASPTAGDTIVINDYASTFATNNVTINFNGNKLEAVTTNATLSTNDQTHTFVFTDATQGWKIVNQDTGASIQPSFISATGGTVTTSGDFKIHSFTGDGCFVVSSLGNPLIPAAARDTVDYLVVAGGGGGGGRHGGGAGAGGFRESKDSTLSSPHTASPLAASTGITVTAQTYPITVGAGGTGGNRNPSSAGTNGSTSVFSTITSAGGGRGHTYQSSTGQSGGSGGGGGHPQCSGGPGGSGNTPPTNPSQGNPGGNTTPAPAPNDFQGAGGGGATASGGGAPSIGGGDGGAGATTSISGSPTAYAGGGGGGKYNTAPGGPGVGGTGGGGTGGGGPPSVPTLANAGTVNTGGGGGGYGGTNCAGNPDPRCQGASGGSGIVVIRYKFQ